MEAPALLEPIYRYHDGTKHHFNRFAQSLGYLDWASQPRPFRSFDGAPVFGLSPGPKATGPGPDLPRVTYDRLFANTPGFILPFTATALGHFLRHALGLSAWKVFQGSRWSLRVNPSSGNLHPTEAYIVVGPNVHPGVHPSAAAAPGLSVDDSSWIPGVWHYAPDRHAIERRSVVDRDTWRLSGVGQGTEAFFIALTSIHWRESWKYGERAFRYCQHDIGHAIGALGLSAALCGWRATLLPGWPHRAVASLIGVDRDEDYVEAEREEPACVMLVTRGAVSESWRSEGVNAAFVDAVRRGRWFGRASRLSEEHVQWTFIDEVARATEDLGQDGQEGAPAAMPSRGQVNPRRGISESSRWRWGPSAIKREVGQEGQKEQKEQKEQTGPAIPAPSAVDVIAGDRRLDARTIILQRRSAVALDGVSSTDRETFMRLLSRALHGSGAPWDALWWSPRIHLALFVHRVEGFAPGLYLLARADSAVPRLKAALRREFVWEPVAEGFPLWLLHAGDYRSLSQRLSCDQAIAADGFFSLGMIADFDAALAEHGPSFYRQLFWESGVIGQVLYLEAEAAGARATGIGCFFDDPVHQLLGLSGRAFQSLYHFTIGIPIEDTRLTTEPGYSWEV